jgi:hypothetical protein
MGILATYCRIKPEQFEQIRAEKVVAFPYATEVVSIDKSWDILNLLLTGRIGLGGGGLLSECFWPDEHFVIYEDKYMTESVRFIQPEKVKAIHQILNEISEDSLINRFEKTDHEMLAKCYPGRWQKDDSRINYLLSNFKNLKKVFCQAAETDEYMTVTIG